MCICVYTNKYYINYIYIYGNATCCPIAPLERGLFRPLKGRVKGLNL